MSPDDTAASDRVRTEAAEIDLRCALAFGRSALQALSRLSAQARADVDRYLALEAEAVRLEQPTGAEAIDAMISDLRMMLRQQSQAEAVDEPGVRRDFVSRG